MTSDELEQQQACPFCQGTQGCEHLILVVDLTFRALLGGVLQDSFESRRRELHVEAGSKSDFNWDESFDRLVSAVSAMADAEVKWSMEDGPPAFSSAYAAYFGSSVQRVHDVQIQFECGVSDRGLSQAEQ